MRILLPAPRSLLPLCYQLVARRLRSTTARRSLLLRSSCNHAAVAVAAVVPITTVLGHAAAGHALIRLQLVPRRRCGRAGCGLTGAIVPRDREQLVAARAAQRGRLTVRQVRSMTAAWAY